MNQYQSKLQYFTNKTVITNCFSKLQINDFDLNNKIDQCKDNIDQIAKNIRSINEDDLIKNKQRIILKIRKKFTNFKLNKLQTRLYVPHKTNNENNIKSISNKKLTLSGLITPKNFESIKRLTERSEGIKDNLTDSVNSTKFKINGFNKNYT